MNTTDEQTGENSNRPDLSWVLLLLVILGGLAVIVWLGLSPVQDAARDSAAAIARVSMLVLVFAVVRRAVSRSLRP
jgi:hypothetical protein